MKKLRKIFGIAIACVMLMSFCACGDPVDTVPSEYTIQYTDNAGTHHITVTAGMPYVMETVPEKTGYKFIGLYDAEVGGTQYVSASGASLSPFTDGKNMVLFPQFAANEYTLILDYQNAAVTGVRSMKVAYGSEISDLPLNLTLEYKDFVGWYTEPNREGIQVADQYGVLPENNKVTEKLFDLSDPEGNIRLYAGFKGTEYTVTFYATEDGAPEEVKVEHGTHISEVQVATRVNGKAVLVWSKTRNDTEKANVFNGYITSEMILYAAEYAPVIEFDSNGGNPVMPLIARAGSTIALPTPTKDLAKFAYWEDMQGNIFEETTMPSTSISLKAVWQAKLVFDENGGTDVDDISVVAGTKITLPTPEKEDFIFAGWYTADKEQYTSTTMPSAGIALKAGWYKSKCVKKDFLSGNNTSSTIYSKTPTLKSAYDIDFTELISEIDWTKSVNVSIEFHADIMHYTESTSNLPLYYTKEHFYYYSQPVVNDAYLVEHIIVDHGNGAVNTSYVTTDFTATMTISGGKIYAALASDQTKETTSWGSHAYGCGWKMTNFWAQIYYPDTSNLYL